MIEISEVDTCNLQSTAYLNQIAIEKIDSHELSYEMFHQKFMNQNVPVVIQSIPQKWNSMRWIKNTDDNLSLDFNYLKQRIPNHKVPIADCTKQHLNSHEKFEMNFYDFLDYWATQMTNDKFYNNKLWYLKDWHLRKHLPSYNFYETPQYFGSDWLNEYLNGKEQDDYMFVYMGPKGSWTPLHSDVFSSYSWSTNIFGIKKWIIICPNEEKKLFDNLGNLPFSITEEILRKKGCTYFCLIQNAGDTIFVPTGWYHQVHNLEHTISINHNFFNGCNISLVWSALFENYQKVVKEIDDCKDMDNFEEHCQIMLKALHGMNFADFLDLLTVVVSSRIKSLRADNQLLINDFVLGKKLCIFDLKSCLAVLNNINECLKELKRCSAKSQEMCKELKILVDDELKKHFACSYGVYITNTFKI